MSFKDQSYRVGNGPTGILLLHGLCGTPAELRFLANGLAQQGYTVLCPTLAGHGGSEALMKASSWTDWYASAKEALEELNATCDTVLVGGLSTGAVLSLMLATENNNNIRGLMLFSPTLWVNGWSIPWYAHLFRLVTCKPLANLIKFPAVATKGIKCPRIRQLVSGALDSARSGLPSMASMPGGAVLERRWLVQATLENLSKINAPTLIVHPREDDYAHLNNVWHLQRTLRGPVEVTVLEDSYHFVTIDKQRHVVLERAAAFAGRLAGSDMKARRTAAAA